MNDVDPQLKKMLNPALDARASELDAATLSRLNRARQHALDEVRHESRGRWLPAGLLAAAAMLMLAIGISRRVPPPAEPLLEQPLPELTILTSDESLEMLENLEFYSWLDEVLSDAEAGDA